MRKSQSLASAIRDLAEGDDAILQEIAFEAFKEALEDAGITQKDIDLSVVGSVGTRLYESLPAVPINEYLGLVGKGPIRIEAACATGSAAIFTAYNSIASDVGHGRRNRR